MNIDERLKKFLMQKSNHGRLFELSNFISIIEFYSRKQQYKLADIITKTDEKVSYQIGTIQSSITNINTRLTDLRDLVCK
jgi:hypothetical protein